MAKIRHEINLLNGVTTASGQTNERAFIDVAQFSGTLTARFETVAHAVDSNVYQINLLKGGGLHVNQNISGTTDTLRSTTFTISTSGEYNLNNNASVTLKAARIVIIQDTGSDPLVQSETQIEIGSRSSVLSTSFPTGATNQTNPKYWKYVAADWDGTCSFYYEVVFSSSSSKTSSEARLQVADGTGDGFTGWSSVTSSLTTLSLTPTRIRTSATFTPIDGRWYRIVSISPTSKTAMNVYCAKIIVRQTPSANDKNLGISGVSDSFGNVTAGQAIGYTFLSSVSQTAIGIAANLRNSGSPTDEVVIYLRDTSSTGTILAQTANITAASLVGVSATDVRYYLFTSSVSLSASTTYYVTFERTGSLSDTNKYLLGRATDSSYADGGQTIKTSGTWFTPSSTIDQTFAILSAPVTELEEQYLMSNTLLAAGTSIQKFLTSWDSSEWSSVTNTYNFQAEAADGSTSDLALKTSDDATTVGTVTDPDNAGTATSLTMPSTQNLDVRATTNNGDLYASRIIVLVVVTSGPTPVTRSASDTNTLSEQAYFSPGYLFPDTVSLSDTSVAVQGRLYSFSDTETLSDSMLSQLFALFSQLLSDSVAISDAAAQTLGMLLLSSDSVSLSDTSILAFVLLLSPTDSLTITDAFSPNLTYLLSNADTFSLLDQSTDILGLLMLFSDTDSFSDSASYSLGAVVVALGRVWAVING